MNKQELLNLTPNEVRFLFETLCYLEGRDFFEGGIQKRLLSDIFKKMNDCLEDSDDIEQVQQELENWEKSKIKSLYSFIELFIGEPSDSIMVHLCKDGKLHKMPVINCEQCQMGDNVHNIRMTEEVYNQRAIG